MPTETAFVGASKRLTFTFTDVAGAPADPTSIALTILEPDGVTISKTEADMANPALGTWTYDHSVAKAGRHGVRCDADGAVEAAVQPEFYAMTKNTP
jgi:hypothetical protein